MDDIKIGDYTLVWIKYSKLMKFYIGECMNKHVDNDEIFFIFLERVYSTSVKYEENIVHEAINGEQNRTEQQQQPEEVARWTIWLQNKLFIQLDIYIIICKTSKLLQNVPIIFWCILFYHFSEFVTHIIVTLLSDNVGWIYLSGISRMWTMFYAY